MGGHGGHILLLRFLRESQGLDGVGPRYRIEIQEAAALRLGQ